MNVPRNIKIPRLKIQQMGQPVIRSVSEPISRTMIQLISRTMI
jgi:hypothetical protein